MHANIVSRVSRLSYGIVIMEPFDESRHREQDRQYVASVDMDCAMNQMYWYLRKNQDIRDQQVLRIPWRRTFRGPLPGNRMSIVLLRSAEEIPPRRRNDAVEIECTISCNVSTPYSQLTEVRNADGDSWKSVEFELEMRPTGTVLQFVAYYQGQAQQPVTITPPFHSTDGLGEDPRDRSRRFEAP